MSLDEVVMETETEKKGLFSRVKDRVSRAKEYISDIVHPTFKVGRYAVLTLAVMATVVAMSAKKLYAESAPGPMFNSSIEYKGTVTEDPNSHNWTLELTNNSMPPEDPNNDCNKVTAYAQNTSDHNIPEDINVVYWNVNSDTNSFTANPNSIDDELTPVPGQNTLYIDFISDSNMLIDSELKVATIDGNSYTIYTQLPGKLKANIGGNDNIVNFVDFSVLAGEWMQVEEWYVEPVTCDPCCPMMDIFYITSQVEDNRIPNPGNELKVTYLVTNTSENDSIYEMNKFILPAGINQGIYDAVAPDDWEREDALISPDETIFSTTSPSAYIDPVDGQGFFQIYSTILDIGQRDAIAYSIANPPEQFNPVPVDVPGILTRGLPPKTLKADIKEDGIVDHEDLGVMCNEWLMQEYPPNNPQ